MNTSEIDAIEQSLAAGGQPINISDEGIDHGILASLALYHWMDCAPGDPCQVTAYRGHRQGAPWCVRVVPPPQDSPMTWARYTFTDPDGRRVSITTEHPHEALALAIRRMRQAWGNLVCEADEPRPVVSVETDEEKEE